MHCFNGSYFNVLNFIATEPDEMMPTEDTQSEEDDIEGSGMDPQIEASPPVTRPNTLSRVRILFNSGAGWGILVRLCVPVYYCCELHEFQYRW